MSISCNGEAPKLILFTGLPGSGKSTLAEAVSQRLQIPLFAKDIVEAALLRCNVTAVLDGTQPVSYAAYEVLLAMAEQQLRLNHSCIIDCVAGVAAVRNHFQTVAGKHNAMRIVVECICSDDETHRTRLTTRQRNIPEFRELGWEELLETKARYIPWAEDRLVVDSMNRLDENVELALSHIRAVDGDKLGL